MPQPHLSFGSRRGAALAKESTRIQPPKLLIAWTPFWPAFLRNIFDFARGTDASKARSSSSPGIFWPDVFVQRPIPWKELTQSAFLHVCTAILVFLSGHSWLGGTTVGLEDRSSESTIRYYKTEEFLPAFEAVMPKPGKHASSKHDPAPSTQEIISVPGDADNGEETIANLEHPEMLGSNVSLPNLIAITAKPKLEAAVPGLAVPSEARAIPSERKSEVDIAVKPEIAELAKLRLESQTTLPLLDARDAILAPPAPGIAGGGIHSEAAARLVVLSARPMPPPLEIRIPNGSRKGAFATSPLGRLGAAGTPGVASVRLTPEIMAGGRIRALNTQEGVGGAELLSGIRISGSQPGLANALADIPAPVVQAQRQTQRPAPKMILLPAIVTASSNDIVREPAATSVITPTSPEANAVFGTRHIYSMQINSPNLSSAGGSWVIHFAEMSVPSMAGELSTPVATKRVDPAYPISLQLEGVQGTIVLYAVIHADGTVGSIRVLHGLDERLDVNAMKALSLWKFRPAAKSGTPVDLEAVVQVPFVARRGTF